jgi:hypothetical protein
MRLSSLRRTRAVALASALIAALWQPTSIARNTATAALTPATRAQEVKAMKIRMDVNGRRVTATLDDNATSRDFIALLPLTLTLEDYNGTEKINKLEKKLSTKDAPAGIDPSVGDIAYYAPWGNVAFFYKDFGYSRGLVKLGRIDSGVDAFERPGTIRVSIQQIDK